MGKVVDDLVSTAGAEKRCELVIGADEVADQDAAKLPALPPTVFALKSLNFLQVARVGLESVPGDIGRLSNMSKLVLHSNKLTSLPAELGSLAKLRYLDVSGNSLGSLPESLSGLTELLILNARENQLTVVPDLSASKEKLTELSCGQNALAEWPQWLAGDNAVGFIHLATVNFPKCQLTAIPGTAARLPGLKVLDLEGNLLETVPGDLAKAARLKELRLQDNPLKDRRLRKMIGDSHVKASAVLDYIRKNCPLDNAQADDAKGKGKGKGKGKVKAQQTSSQEDSGESGDQGPCVEISLAEDHYRVVTTAQAHAVRPHLICALVRGLDLSKEGALKKFLQIQNKLHDAEDGCRKRQGATLATHDLAQLRFPLTYTAREPAALRMTPLRGAGPKTAQDIVAALNEEAEAQRKKEKRSTYSSLHKYLYLVKPLAEYPCVVDAEGEVVSFPPISNADLTKLSAETTDILIEVSSAESQPLCRKVTGQLLAHMLAANLSADPERLTVQQVKVVKEDGSVHAAFPDKNDLADLNTKRLWIKS